VPAAARDLADTVYACDAMVWSTPTYHGSVSGSFKNALDWLILLAERDPPYLTNKPIGLVTTAGGVQGLQAINSMDFIVRALRGWSVPLVQPVAQSWRTFDPDGRLVDDMVAVQLRELGAEVGACRASAPGRRYVRLRGRRPVRAGAQAVAGGLALGRLRHGLLRGQPG
jgi:FMN reductase